MNFKSFTLKAAIAATVLTGSTLAVAPAEALVVGDKIYFGGFADFTETSIDFYLKDTNTLDGFPANNGSPGEISITSVIGTGPWNDLGTSSVQQIADLPVFTSINNFLFFGNNNPFNFRLTSFSHIENNAGLLTYEFTGLFADGTDATGTLSAEVAAGFGGYSAEIIAGEKIPTPALLPGLIGMGAAVLRKRNAEETEQSEAEA
jgi:hypothetical protein